MLVVMDAVPPPPPTVGQPPPPRWDAAPAGYGGQGGGRTPAPGAVVSLVFGIAGLTVLFFIGSIVALVLGYQSRRAALAEPDLYDDQLGQIGRVLGWIGVGLGLAMIVVMIVVLLFVVIVSATTSV